MKISNKELIRRGEQDLIDAITADLDWGVIEDIFREEHNLPLDDDVRYKRGDIVIHDDQIVYQLDFDVKVSVSLLLDRAGNCIAFRAQEPPASSGEVTETPQTAPDPPSQGPLSSADPGRVPQGADPGPSDPPETALQDRVAETASRAAGTLAALRP